MDNIKVLEEIGLKKVCEETHIEQKYLKYMVDNDYEKLDHINTLGFVKILSREYKIDLSAWNEAFEEYWVENRLDVEDDGMFIVVNDKKKSSKLLKLILLVILGAVVSLIFSIFQDKIDIANYMNNEESSYENTTTIQEAQQTLDEINSSANEVLIDDINSSEVMMNVDENETQEVVVEEPVVEEEKKVEPILEIQKVKEPTEKVSPRFSQEAVISPNSKLWIGVIYLDTNKRRSFVGEGNFSIDISREQIITTGHGSFNLSMNGEQKEFKRQAPIRFLVKDSNITEINLSKFKELNEGKSW